MIKTLSKNNKKHVMLDNGVYIHKREIIDKSEQSKLAFGAFLEYTPRKDGPSVVYPTGREFYVIFDSIRSIHICICTEGVEFHESKKETPCEWEALFWAY